MKQSATLDSSFWINTHRAGLTAYLFERYTLYYAPDVAAELSPSFASGQEFWRLVQAGDLATATPQHEVVGAFGAGERAAMNLTIEHPGWVLLLDDYRPYQEATRRGLPVLCSPALTAALFADGTLGADDTLLALARLAALQTVSPHLLAAALALVAMTWTNRKGRP